MRITRIALGFCFALIFCLPAAAQTTSNIEGTVKDARGAVVPGAEVKAASPVLAVTRSTTTDENGFYRITALAAGNYSVTVTATGFATSTISDVELTLNRTLALDIQLEVGAVTGQINVTAETLLIDPTTAATGSTVTPFAFDIEVSMPELCAPVSEA